MLRVDVGVHSDGVNGKESCSWRQSIRKGLVKGSDQMLCVSDVRWQELSYNFLEPIVDMFGKYFRDAVDGTAHWTWLYVLLMDFLDAIDLGDASLSEM